MTTFSKYIIDFDNLKIKNQQVVSMYEWDDLISENGVQFMTNSQYIQFDCNGLDMIVDFNIQLDEQSSYDIAIKSLLIDNIFVELNKCLTDTLKEEIKKQLV
jgi:hypothetical protein